ncbi:aldo/keto reductase [Nakamurella sp. YIM 132087]|uniref:Aldo/keto reductase n=1 Tax=Nakamurella alba TaxID=2665158 RepID=A0A7K1FM21_9ACTN|nr:aldo/keto reductase [Nakamurella alba]MTD13934.1 aldo/keto reductase [Nakamurella alba]
MESRRVGRSGLTVSRLGLGTMTWGRDTDADDAAAQLESFVGSGGTLIDTANIYGDGDAEAIIGTLVPDVVPRSDVVLATTTVGVGGGRGRLLAALDESLRRLGTDHVDLWQVHGYDGAVPFEETCAVLRTAVDSGRARYVGVSGFTGWQLATFATALRSPAGVSLVSAEAEYSLADRSPEESLLPAAHAHGVGLIGWAPLGRGVLTGKYRHGTPADSRGASPHFARYVGRHRTDHTARIVEAVATAAEGLGTSPLAVACAWVRDRPGVSAVVVGARDNAQLQGSLAGQDLVLPAEIVSALADVSDPDGDEDL